MTRRDHDDEETQEETFGSGNTPYRAENLGGYWSPIFDRLALSYEAPFVE